MNLVRSLALLDATKIVCSNIIYAIHARWRLPLTGRGRRNRKHCMRVGIIICNQAGGGKWCIPASYLPAKARAGEAVLAMNDTCLLN